MIGYLIYFDGFKSDDFINSPYNTRQDSFSDRVVRGKILSSDGQVLAQTNVSEDGTETRNYPWKKRSGIRSELYPSDFPFFFSDSDEEPVP